MKGIVLYALDSGSTFRKYSHSNKLTIPAG